MSFSIAGFLLLLVVLLALRVPIFLALGITGFVGLVFVSPMSPSSIPAIFFNSVDKFILTAIPFFILMGNLLVKGNTSAHIIGFLRTLVGHLPGGLMVVSVLACMIFAALTGTVSTGVVAIGGILIPAMVQQGYEKRFAMGAIAAGSTLGVLIPPSIVMIIFGDLADQSVGKLFAAGIIPGLLIGGMLILLVIFIARRGGYVPAPRASLSEVWATGKKAVPVMILPVVILGGLYGGFFGPTEAAAVAAALAFIVSVLVYRDLPIRQIPEVLRDTVRLTSMIYMIVAGASLFSVALTYLKIPQTVTSMIMDHVSSPQQFLIYLMILVLIMGCFLDAISILYIVVPLIAPLIQPLGVDPIHLAVLLTINIEIGALTPPVGLNLFVVSAVGKAPVEETIKGITPFIITLLAGLIIVLLWPGLSTWLPSHMN